MNRELGHPTRTPWTSWTKDVMLPSSSRPSTNRRCNGTIVNGYGARAFNVGDLVLYLVQSNKDHHKLSLPWEGPYIIMEVLRPGAYKLKTINNEVFANA